MKDGGAIARTEVLVIRKAVAADVAAICEKDRLLRKYWSIPERQIETSVVLADGRWTQRLSSHG